MPLKLLFPSITLEMKPVYRLNHPINQNQAICARKAATSNDPQSPRHHAPCVHWTATAAPICGSHSKGFSLFFHVSAIVYDRGYLGPKSDPFKME
jgi:hypothetical protein